MVRIAVKEVRIARQFEAHHYTGDDGYPAAKVFSPLYAITEDGREFYLPLGRQVRDEEGFVGYVARYDADRLADKVRVAGSIDPTRWVELEVSSLEDRLQEAFEIEGHDRFEQTGSYL